MKYYYTLDNTIDLGGVDSRNYGFVLSFNNASGTPEAIDFPLELITQDLYDGELTGILHGVSGSDINSIVNNGDWNLFLNKTNVLSYEYGSFGGTVSNDFSFQLQVTVMGDVEGIDLYAHSDNTIGTTDGAYIYMIPTFDYINTDEDFILIILKLSLI